MLDKVDALGFEQGFRAAAIAAEFTRIDFDGCHGPLRREKTFFRHIGPPSALAKVKTVTSAAPAFFSSAGRRRHRRAGRIDVVDKNDTSAEDVVFAS